MIGSKPEAQRAQRCLMHAILLVSQELVLCQSDASWTMV